MDARTGSRAEDRPKTNVDLLVVVGPTEEDGSVTLTIKLAKSAGLATLRELLLPSMNSPVCQSTGRAERNQREPSQASLPAGMTSWVSAKDVARAMSCSSSKAHEYLRTAAGRPVGTSRMLRVPVDIWEAWARDNLVDSRRNVRPRPPSCTTERPVGTSGMPKRRKLGPYSEVKSELPLLPTLKFAKMSG